MNRLYLRNHSSDWHKTWLFEENSSNYVGIHYFHDKFGPTKFFFWGFHDFLKFVNENVWNFRRFSKLSWKFRKSWFFLENLKFSENSIIFENFLIFSTSKFGNVFSSASDFRKNCIFGEISSRASSLLKESWFDSTRLTSCGCISKNTNSCGCTSKNTKNCGCVKWKYQNFKFFKKS